MGDFMKNALIKQESKAFIKGKRVKALSIILFLLIFCIVMTAVDFGIIFIADILRHLGVAATIALSAARYLSAKKHGTAALRPIKETFQKDFSFGLNQKIPCVLFDSKHYYFF